MDEISDHDLGEALRRASEHTERPTVVSVAAALRTQISGPGDPLLQVVAALDYYPIEGCDHAMLDDPGARAQWARAHGVAPRPLLAARFADVLWSTRHGETPEQWATRAVDDYLAAAADGFGHVLEITEGLQRALAIATEADDSQRRVAVIAALVVLASRSIESEEGSSGVAISILTSIAALPPTDRPEQLGPLLERALARYRDDPWLLEAALEIQARLVEPSARERLRIAQIDAFARVARATTGPLRHAHYEHAIEIAERHGLRALAEQLRGELDRPPLKWGDAVEGFVDHIVGDDSLGNALARFGAALPTEGGGGAGDPAERQRLSFFGILAVDLLVRIRGRYGTVSAAGAWFECALIEPAVATLLAHGAELYESVELNEAAAVLALQLDRITRAVAIAAGDIEIGTDVEIGEVLAMLAGTLYEPSRRYLRALLTEPAPDPTAQEAALLIHAACHLRLLQPVEVTRALPGV
ncbi:MAG TPA: hypothetical protein VL769_07145 [Acidimicrobiia bacterium]|nr:hypothetical protein [Acidimicrobiia bacterium]